MAVDVYTLADQDTQLKRVAVGEYAGPCPRCHGTDRFRVNMRKREGGAWMCRGCWDASDKGWADAIEYLRQMRGMSFPEAKAYAEDGEEARQRVNKAIRQVERYGKAPAQDWQERALAWVKSAVERLWTEEGGQALAYLRGRGLKDETIRAAMLGYARYKHPETKQVVPCIVIPWADTEAIWRVQLRDIRPDVPHDKRYFMLPGSSNAGLYMAVSLRLKRDILIMVEGEIDALTIAQEGGDLAAVVATGTTKGSRTPQWIGRLARAGRVLIAYDNDTKGNENAEYWLKALENAIPYKPLEKDVNDMLLAGYDVRSWISAMLEPAQPIEQEQELEDYGSDWCATCSDLGIDTPAEYEQEGFMYCAQHRPGVAQDDAAQPIEQEQEPQPLPESPQERFLAIVERIAGIFPNGCAIGPVEPASAPMVPAQYRRYIPLTLKENRTACPFIMTKEGKRLSPNSHAIIAQECSAIATHDGWCEKHKHSHTLLVLGAELCYPALQIHENRWIERGVNNWEAYAVTATTRALRHDLPRLKAMIDKRNRVAV